MAAYAALVCLEHIVDNLQLHPRPPISLQKNQVDLLTQKITFLQQFLQGYNPNLSYNTEVDPLESRITDAAHAAEGAIQSHIADQITNDREKISSDAVFQALEKVIEEMALIEEEALKIKQTHVGVQHQHQLHTKSTPPDSSRSSSSTVKKSMMVGADDVLLEMKYELTSNRRDLQIIPIVGMGGTGKTTLAMNIYQDDLIQENFDIYAWTTISQEYSLREILTQLLRHLLGDNALGEILQKLDKVDKLLSENKLGETLYKYLYGKKYIIVMDDLWSINAWDEVKKSLPDNGNGSRIIVTTRLSNLAARLTGSKSLEMCLLNEIDSWELLSKTVFGEQSCPVELEEIGKKIGKSCKGLPLSIVVVGGLLSKSDQTSEVWKDIEDNLNSIVNSEDDERCLKILHMSYKQLPVYLKPCFLYMGVFPEDDVIGISRLAKLWVAEGFLKPVSGKVLEEIAKEYLKELVDRNLVLIHKKGCTGNIKQCKIHDLLRDLSLREAQKGRFYTIATGEGEELLHSQGRILFYNTVDGEAMSHMSLPHSSEESQEQKPLDYRFTRIVEAFIGDSDDEESLENMRQLVNSRFLALTFPIRSLFPPFWKFWNLQTLIVSKYCAYRGYSPPNDIWCMPSIRHVHFDHLQLPDIPYGGEGDDVVLTNLQTLGKVWEFKCSEQVVKRIPNIRKLSIVYGKGVDDRFALTNLDRLDKLESLKCIFNRGMCPINLPHSLKKLTIQVHNTECWQVVLDKIGTLPLLQKLMLMSGTFEQGQWETTEGQFRSLKYLCLSSCDGPQVWKAESSHFPRLEHLLIYRVREPSGIPFDFAEIPTLRIIESDTSRSIMESAKRILEKQEELYGEETGLQVHVKIYGTIDEYDEEVRSLASPNFRFVSHD